jgi:hypothetical protein
MTELSKKKTLFIGAVSNKAVILPNGLISMPLIGITLTVHPGDRTWSVHIHLIFWRLDFGWVDKV